MTDERDADERDALAAEYVIGLLDAPDIARCERLLAEEPDFAVRVEGWRQRLAEIDQTAPLMAPPPQLWSRIEAAAGMARTQAPRRPRQPGRIARLWNHLPVWRGIGLVASAAALLMMAGTAYVVRQSARAPVLVAVLLSDANQPAAIVNAFRDGRTQFVPLQAIAAPEGKALQVWTLWDRARGPVSVGLLDALRQIDLSVAGLPAPTPDQLFEVTLEPAGGSPTGRPTGPILMKGNASRTDAGT
ncbi:MAG TPA: anti-sigma factor [Xanthobacteraceae bacterium]|nr:anti-sigma factor [Xanthobacteraceae bacterium]